MVTLSKAQTGARVYQGASLAPNRGQVSAQGAQGYIQREIRKQQGPVTPYGADGQSDRRSGVAAAAIAAKGPGTGPPPDSNGTSGPGTGPPTPVGGNHGGMTPQGAPTVQVTEDGILQLPYNQQLAQEQYQALDSANSDLLQLNKDAGNEALQYGQQKRDTQLQYDKTKKSTLNSNASHGTAYSSKYGTAVVNNANLFANQMGDIEASHNNFAAQQAQQRAAIQAALNNALGYGIQGYADDLNGSAGSLGYGTNPTHVYDEDPHNGGPKGNKHKNKNKHKGGPKFHQEAARLYLRKTR